MNIGTYWFSDKIVLSRYGAEEVSESDAPDLHRVVSRLSEKAGIPKPSVHVIDSSNPNAFATGRGPSHAAVAVTTGLIETLDEDELEGVLAHELSHVMNRDTLISTITATFAGAIAMLATMARFTALFGLGGRRDNNIFVILAMAIVAPLAASVIQMAVSRSREYKADEAGARLCGKPMSLARALRKLEEGSQRRPMEQASEQTAHLFIVNPISGDTFRNLFSTHPSVEDRVQRLEELARDVA
jgi:heat shock protein HtpX